MLAANDYPFSNVDPRQLSPIMRLSQTGLSELTMVGLGSPGGLCGTQGLFGPGNCWGDWAG